MCRSTLSKFWLRVLASNIFSFVLQLLQQKQAQPHELENNSFPAFNTGQKDIFNRAVGAVHSGVRIDNHTDQLGSPPRGAYRTVVYKRTLLQENEGTCRKQQTLRV